MTFADWLNESARRYRTQSPWRATVASAHELRMGATRRIGLLIGKRIWDRGDWDVLVVLDACRNDLMQSVAPEYDILPNDPGHCWSNASCSIDWILRNFSAHPEHARRSGYITGNPFTDHTADDAPTADLSGDDFAYFAPLYKTEWGAVDGGPVETIPPAPLTDQAIAAWRRRDELGMDRLVVHYMQPHQPYRSKPEWTGVNKNLKDLVKTRTKAGACAWQECRQGNIDAEELWTACRDNLRWVLDDVTQRLLQNVDGKVVLTADHGNAMGELGEWGHHPGAIGPAVRKVPWAPVEAADKRTVTPDVDLQRRTAVDDTIESKLDSLGYL